MESLANGEGVDLAESGAMDKFQQQVCRPGQCLPGSRGGLQGSLSAD